MAYPLCPVDLFGGYTFPRTDDADPNTHVRNTSHTLVSVRSSPAFHRDPKRRGAYDARVFAFRNRSMQRIQNAGQDGSNLSHMSLGLFIAPPMSATPVIAGPGLLSL